MISGCFSGKYEKMLKMVKIIEKGQIMKKRPKMEEESKNSVRSGFFLERHGNMSQNVKTDGKE
jgi:hypothetical protein